MTTTRWLVARRLCGVPVLNYHGVAASAPPRTDDWERKYWITAATLRHQLEQLRHGNYRVTLLGPLWSGPPRSSDFRRPVVLTFDDGRTSDHQVVYPLLLEAGARAEFFVNTGTIGRAGHLTWEQIAEMQRHGLSFQSHSHDHVMLVGLPPRRLDRQLRDSKHLLEDRLGRPVEFLAVPYGLLSRRVVAAAGEAGYRAVCGSRQWPARPGADVVHRVAVYAHTDRREYAELLDGRPLPYLRRTARAVLTFVPRHVVLRVAPSLRGVQVLEEGT